MQSQDVAYSILKNAIDNNKLSHAYLFDSNGYNDVMKFVMSFVKVVFCGNNYTNSTNCHDCNICHRIDNGNFLEVKIIEPDGLNIKKEQLLELQDDFSYSGLESKRRVYIIKNCDKMTVQAANSMLKFLEEPNYDIIALLITDNFSSVLSTIVSRCQVIKLKNINVDLKNNALDNFNILYGDAALDKDKISDILNSVLEFVNFIDDNGMDTLIYLKKIWHSIIKDRVDNTIALDLLINFYYDVLKFKCNNDNLFFKDYMNVVEKISNNSNINDIIRNIDVCVDARDMLGCNLNINLLIDNMVIELEGV